MTVPSEEFPRNAKDVIQRALAHILQDSLLEWYGLQLPRIVQAYPPNVPIIDVHEKVLDAVFRTEDGQLLNVEFQSTPVPSLVRLGNYALHLADKYGCSVRTVVIYLSGVRDAVTDEDWGTIRVHVHNVYLANKNAEDAIRRIQRTRPEDWTIYDDLDLAFLPFMGHRDLTQQQLVAQSVDLLPHIPKTHQSYVGALIAGLTSNFLSADMLNSLKEVIRMTELIRQLEEEAIARGLEKGLQQGREQGLQEGLKEGRHDGQLQAAITILRARFGPLSEAVVTELSCLDATDIMRFLLPKILEVSTLDELLAAIRIDKEH